MANTLGTALRAIGGGEVKVMLRVSDIALKADLEKGIGGCGQELLALSASDYREVEPDSDVWRFTVIEDAVERYCYACGADVLLISTEPRVSVVG